MTLKEKQIFLLLASARWNVPILEDRLTTEEVRLTLPIPFMEYSEGGINVALNVALNTKYLSEKIGVNRKTIQRELSILQQRKLTQLSRCP